MMLPVCEMVIASQLVMAPGVVLSGPVVKEIRGKNQKVVHVRFIDGTSRWMNENSCFYRKAKVERGKSSKN